MEALKREMAARAKSERECKEAEQKLKEMQEAIENHQSEIQEARDTISRLEQQLQETQVHRHCFYVYCLWYKLLKYTVFSLKKMHKNCRNDGGKNSQKSAILASFFI